MADLTPKETFKKLCKIRFYRWKGGEDELSSEEMVRLVGLLDVKHVKLVWFGPSYARFEEESPVIHEIAHLCPGESVVDLLKALIGRAKELGISPDTIDYDGRTLMHYAAHNRTGEVLIKNLTECDVNLCDNDGETPVMLASRRDEYLNNLKALHERGASLTYVPPPCPAACCRGRTDEPAVLMAINSKAIECARYLAENGALYNPSGERRALFTEAAEKAGPEYKELLRQYMKRSKLGEENYCKKQK